MKLSNIFILFAGFILLAGVASFVWPHIQVYVMQVQVDTYCTELCELVPESRMISATARPDSGQNVVFGSLQYVLPADATLSKEGDAVVRVDFGEAQSVTILRGNFRDLEVKFAEAGGHSMSSREWRELMPDNMRKPYFMSQIFTSIPVSISEQDSTYHSVQQAAFLLMKASLMTADAKDAFYAYDLQLSSDNRIMSKAYQIGTSESARIELGPATFDEYWYTLLFQNFTQPQVDEVLTSIKVVEVDTHMNTQQAQAIANAYINSLEDEHKLSLLDEKTQKRDFGWIFFYNSARFAETQDTQDAIPGIGPLLVDNNGNTHQLPSTEDPGQLINRAESAFNLAQQKLRSKTHASDQYYLDEISLIDQQADVWLIRFGIPDMDGAQVEIEVNTKTKEVINYHDSWS